MRLSLQSAAASIVVAAFLALWALSGMAMSPTTLASWAQAEEKTEERPGPDADPVNGKFQREMAATAVRFAQKQVGKPYIAGMRGPSAYDCSGLTWAAYAAAGLSWPMSMALSYQQWNPKAYGVSTQWTIPIEPGKERPGDLVFFDWYANPSDAPRGLTGVNGVDHVGIVEDARRGLMIEAANPSAGVIRSEYRTGGNGARLIGFARVVYR